MDEISNLQQQDGRIFIVTGANTGLGYENSLTLAKKGAKVIMACRSMEKAKAAKETLKNEVANADVEVMEIDLSSLDSVRNFAKAYQSKYDRLDVLINNAGVMMPPYTKTEDGLELQFEANFLGHFLLTGLLLDKLLKTPDSRVVSLSSIAHKNGKINFDDLQSEKKYSASDAYGQSKLACLMFAYELQRRLEKAGHKQTISTAAHPGIATTELARHMPKLVYVILKYTVAPFLTHAPKEGAKPTILAAIGKAEGGDYFGPTGFNEFKGKPGKVSSTDLSKDEDIAKRLWEKAEELAGLRYL
ncbi:NAD(P)-dependent dehydrogenase, short-chain alcohol dehydrogenase family [Marivirga sericea]|uniref:NAD(P)-dependent dehydrogenase, short-chain alcohol dehydrogenase family n=1 Tax=Marivirga sericea TaxID=1028 RepID=A0A1X7LH70_9BACT|nr:oxidoreductase [Marivirga sericea]SMG52529.1 NAD(P)-dependent dehydrogenase, short-chain alcohol dehydrogenase family [Marivirga sericea]